MLSELLNVFPTLVSCVVHISIERINKSPMFVSW
jgi:hypothetical protein